MIQQNFIQSIVSGGGLRNNHSDSASSLTSTGSFTTEQNIQVPGKPHLKVENLNVHINGNHILKNVHTEIPEKKITCIIGPSGCGKTTLLKTFNKLLDTSADIKVDGNIWFHDQNIQDPHIEPTQIRKKMGLLSQRPCPLPMSIYDNIAYGCKIHGIKDKKVLNRIVEDYLKAAGLWDEVKDRLHTPASRLSIGQQQRLCLARGLAVEPEIILGDEATSALDPISSLYIEKLFMALKEKYTIILVTHFLSQAKRIADNIVFMYMGAVVESGTVDQIFNHPKQQLTKDYISGSFS